MGAKRFACSRTNIKVYMIECYILGCVSPGLDLKPHFLVTLLEKHPVV